MHGSCITPGQNFEYYVFSNSEQLLLYEVQENTGQTNLEQRIVTSWR